MKPAISKKRSFKRVARYAKYSLATASICLQKGGRQEYYSHIQTRHKSETAVPTITSRWGLATCLKIADQFAATMLSPRSRVRKDSVGLSPVFRPSNFKVLIGRFQTPYLGVQVTVQRQHRESIAYEPPGQAPLTVGRDRAGGKFQWKTLLESLRITGHLIARYPGSSRPICFVWSQVGTAPRSFRTKPLGDMGQWH